MVNINTMNNTLIKFKVGKANHWNDENTKKLRVMIEDEFRGGKNRWDLQCTEYVQYRLSREGVDIKWPVQYGRHGGKWADIFLKYKMYKILDVPKVGCAMSFCDGLKGSARETGHIAFIENIFPNQSIYISEANWPGQGRYNERKLAKAIWHDKYKAKFIDFC